MRFDFSLSKKIGRLYSGGSIAFARNGKHLLSSAGPHVLLFDLQKQESEALTLEHRLDTSFIAISPDSKLLISFDCEGNGIFFNLEQKTLLSKFSAKAEVKHASFSPDGRYFSLSVDNSLTLWHAPDPCKKISAPLSLQKKLSKIITQTANIQWSADSRYLLVASGTLSYLFRIDDNACLSLSEQRGACLGMWFLEGDTKVLSLTRAGDIHFWNFDSKAFTLQKISKKGIEKEDGEFVSGASFSAEKRCLFVVFAERVLRVDVDSLVTASMPKEEALSSHCLTADGEWVAVASQKTGLLAVFEWKTESYIFKQHGHVQPITKIALSKDGLHLATGDAAGLLKLWSPTSGLCKATFGESTDSVAGICFTKRNTLLAAYDDGILALFDTIRMIRFRTFTTPNNERPSEIAIDNVSEFVCAALKETFRIALWSVQTGALLETFSTHTGPVSSLSFGPERGAHLLSASWDKTASVRELFSRTGSAIELLHDSEVDAAAFSPSEREIATSTLKGDILFWADSQLLLSVNCRHDICEELFFEEKTGRSHFSSLCYTPDGLFVAASGRSPFMCFYDCKSGNMHRKFQISALQSIYHKNKHLPRRDTAQKNVIVFPDAHSWLATSQEGALVYSLDETQFDPIEANIKTDPAEIKEDLKEGRFFGALLSALRLKQKSLVMAVLLQTPLAHIKEVVSLLPETYLVLFLASVGTLLESEAQVGLLLFWLQTCFLVHERKIRKNKGMLAPSLRKVSTSLAASYEQIEKNVSSLLGSLEYLLVLADLKKLSPE
eukprot:GHVN01063719.1.p1 GENE.GHVN01063719.1~~GHVN01063719.1.p1  ORF type:complete len:780 (-),score=65.44 GHVN01063719.1:2747-5086(-)